MVFGSRVEKKAAVDVVVWMFNVVILVGIIIVNKVLMVIYGFSFGKCFILYLFLCIKCISGEEK